MHELPGDDLSQDALSDAALVRIYLPLVLAADGSQDVHWSQARLLTRLAGRVLWVHYWNTPWAEELILRALNELLDHLARNDGFFNPRAPAGWPRVQAQLERVMVLVQSLQP